MTRTRDVPAAALVDVSLRASQSPGTAFAVSHDARAGTGPVDVPLTSGGDQGDIGDLGETEHFAASEVFVTDLDGIRQTIATSRDAWPAATAPTVDVTTASGGTRGEEAWSGVVSGEPAFFYSFRDKLDVLVTVRAVPWTYDPDDGVVLTSLLRDLTGAARDFGLPTTFVRSPSAGFLDSPRDMGSPAANGRDPVLARGANVRLTVGLDSEADDARIGFLHRVDGIAAAAGAALHVADRRFGPLSGHWVPVRALVERPPRPGARSDGAPTTDVAGVTLVTVVGPARLGSFSAVLAGFDDAGLTVHAASCLSQQDVAAVQALLATGAGAPALDAGPLSDFLASVAGRPVAVDEAARGHVCLASAPVSPPDGDPSAAGHPVWASWEVRDLDPEHPGASPSGTAAALLTRLRATGRVGTVQPEYHRVRRSSATTLVERLKLAVPLLPGAGTHTLDEVCAAVWSDLQRDRRLPGGSSPGTTRSRVVRLRLAARERWLGTWIDDPR